MVRFTTPVSLPVARTHSNRGGASPASFAGMEGDKDRHSFPIARVLSSPAQGAVLDPTPPTGRLHKFNHDAALAARIQAKKARMK